MIGEFNIDGSRIGRKFRRSGDRGSSSVCNDRITSEFSDRIVG